MARTASRDLEIKVSVADTAGAPLEAIAKRIEGLAKAEQSVVSASKKRATEVEKNQAAETRARERAEALARKLIERQEREETKARERATRVLERELEKQKRAQEKAAQQEIQRLQKIEDAILATARREEQLRRETANSRARMAEEAKANSFGGQLGSALSFSPKMAAIGTIIGSLEALRRATIASIESAAEHEQIMVTLDAAIAMHGYQIGVSASELDRRNEIVERSLGIDADKLAALQAEMAMLGVAPDQLERATQAAIGWSQITGQSVDAVGRDVALVFEGEVPRALAKFGKDLTTVDERLAFMAKGLSVAEARANTAEGSLRKLTIAAGNLGEQLVTPAIEAAPIIFAGMTSAIETTGEAIAKTNGQMLSFIPIIGNIAAAANSAANAIRSLKKNMDATPIASGSGGTMPVFGGQIVEKLPTGPFFSPEERAARAAERSGQEADAEFAKKRADERAKALAEQKKIEDEHIKLQQDAIAKQKQLWDEYNKKISAWTAAADRGIDLGPLPRRPDIIGPVTPDAVSGLDLIRKGPTDEIVARAKEIAADNRTRRIEVENQLMQKQYNWASLAADASKSAVDILVDGFTNGFQDIDKQFGQLILSMIKQIVASGILRLLGSLIGGPFGGVAGGQLGAQLFSRGGPVRRFAAGGRVVGEPGIDRIPAMLEHDEYIIPASVTRAIRAQAAPIAPVVVGPQSGATARNITVNYAPNSAIPASAADVARQLRKGVLPALARLR